MNLRFKRHYKLLVLLVLASALLIAGVGDERIIAYSVSGSEPVVEQAIRIGTGVTPFEETAAAGSQVLILGPGYDILGAGQD